MKWKHVMLRVIKHIRGGAPAAAVNTGLVLVFTGWWDMSLVAANLLAGSIAGQVGFLFHEHYTYEDWHTKEYRVIRWLKACPIFLIVMAVNWLSTKGFSKLMPTHDGWVYAIAFVLCGVTSFSLYYKFSHKQPPCPAEPVDELARN
jgi:putative flippase GtrA